MKHHISALLAGLSALLTGLILLTISCGHPPVQTSVTITSVLTTAPTESGAHVDIAKARHERIMNEQKTRLASPTPGSSETREADSASGPPSAADQAVEALGRSATSSVVLSNGQTPLQGTWQGTAQDLATFLLRVSPAPRFTVPTETLAAYYLHYCAEAGLRADLLWAQMIHETGYGMYGGDVDPFQNNYAGMGATGDGTAGVAFTSAEAGVMAHIAHMVAYVFTSSPISWANSTVDPRFDAVQPRGSVSVLSDLDGRWAVPGFGYGETIEDIARAINTD